MYDRILIPTDAGDVAAAAGETAIALARRFDATVHVVHVLSLGDLPPGVDDPAATDIETGGESAVETLAEQVEAAGLDVRTALVEAGSSVHQALATYAERHDVDIVVMGTHHRSGVDRFLFGSVAERTVSDSPVPVMTVHEETDFDPSFPSILVPTDGSRCARLAFEHAVDLATETGATLHLLHVVDMTAVWGEVDTIQFLDILEESGETLLDQLAETASDAGVSGVETELATGTPYREITEYADGHDVGCLVMGTHGRTGLERFFLGSVTSRVIRLADAPVISIPPDGAAISTDATE